MRNVQVSTVSKSNQTRRNVRSVRDFEKSILSQLRNATRPWFEVASLFAEAQTELKPAQFKQLCEKLQFSYSTARKLIKIAECDRLAVYADKLASVTAWSVLHEIAKLDPASFDDFAKEYLIDESVCTVQRSDVEKFKVPKNVKTAVKLQSFFTVQIDPSSELSMLEKKIIFDAAESLEQNLSSKCRIKWFVDKSDLTAQASESIQ